MEQRPSSAPCPSGTSPISITAPDAPEVARDLEKAAAEARRIKEAYRGKLVELASTAPGSPRRSRSSSASSRLWAGSGRMPGCYYAADQSDQTRAKFYGDISEKLTAISTDIIFFDLELNQIEDAAHGGGARRARGWPATSRGSTNVRKEKPYQLEEKLERLFHEKSQTSQRRPGTGCSTRR